MFDLREGIGAAEISLLSWQRKFNVCERQPIIYMQILFGRLGCERVQATLKDIQVLTGTIQQDIDLIISCALRARPRHSRADEWLVEDCLTRTWRKTSWSRKFFLNVLERAEDLEMHLECLHRRLTMLERFSDYYLEKEHPDIFLGLERLPGRKPVLKPGNRRSGSLQIKLLDALSAQKDAEMLHKASGEDSRVHIGLSVPQIREQDFAFLLSLGGSTHEVLVHPVKIKAVNGSTRIHSSLMTAIPNLTQSQAKHDVSYLKPWPHSSAGFQLTIPPTPLLTTLQYKLPLSAIFQTQHPRINSQLLYPQDQVALSTAIARASIRLLNTPWLDHLTSSNLRWRRTTSGEHTVMLARTHIESPMSRALASYIAAHKPRRDLGKHTQIFRIGIVLAELCLKIPLEHIVFDAHTATVRIFVGDEEVGAAELAAEVERKCNVFLGNMVGFCLGSLKDCDGVGDGGIEGAYLVDVVREAERLEGVVRAARIWGGVKGRQRAAERA
ncbi:Protein spt10 [Ascochyta clinopodiicola]|nr:Protein spt10 [Ascochyta clinopodiicola]